MATHSVPILGFATRPDDTGEAWFEPADLNFGSNDLARQMVLALGSALAAQPTVKHGIYGAFPVPWDYVTAAGIDITYGSTLTSGTARLVFEYRDVDNSAGGLDPSTWQETITTDEAVPGTARNIQQILIDMNDANVVAGDIILFRFSRDGSHANDTLAGRFYVFGLEFEYEDV